MRVRRGGCVVLGVAVADCFRKSLGVPRFEKKRFVVHRLRAKLRLALEILEQENVLISFPTTPSPDVSARYVHIDTNEFVKAMAQEGFKVASVQRDNVRRRDPQYARHMVRFEHDSPDLRADIRPQVLLMNSHNRTTRATVALGLIRFACFNGMIVGDIAHRVAVAHTGDAARELIQRAQALAKNTTQLYTQIDHWSGKQLSKSRQLDLAGAAAKLRWGDSGVFDPAELLRIRREEDEGDDLWHVFNRIQENATKGGIEGKTALNRRIVSRPLTEIVVDARFNAELWSAAAEFAQ